MHGESEDVAKRIKEGLGARAKGREVFANGDVCHLRERGAGYGGDDSCLEDDDIGIENESFRNVFPARSEEQLGPTPIHNPAI